MLHLPHLEHSAHHHSRYDSSSHLVLTRSLSVTRTHTLNYCQPVRTQHRHQHLVRAVKESNGNSNNSSSSSSSTGPTVWEEGTEWQYGEDAPLADDDGDDVLYGDDGDLETDELYGDEFWLGITSPWQEDNSQGRQPEQTTTAAPDQEGLPEGWLDRLMPPTGQQLDAFSALWAEYGRELQLSRETIALINSQVVKGLLPCDARALRVKALSVLKLEDKLPEIRSRYLLANSPYTLGVGAARISQSARRVRKWLPGRDLSSLLVTLMPALMPGIHVDHPLNELLALEQVLCPLWGGAAVDPRVANVWLRHRVGDVKRGRNSPNHQQVKAPETLNLNSIKTICEVMIELMGPEPAYTTIGKAAGLLLRLTPEQARERYTAVQSSLGLSSTQTVLLVEQEPRVLGMTPLQLTTQVSGLAIALGWSKVQTSSLIQSCPRALLVMPSTAASHWRTLTRVVQGRQQWATLVERTPAQALGLILSQRYPPICLSRIQYLTSIGNQDLPGVRLEYVVKMSQPAFVQRCPGFYAKG